MGSSLCRALACTHFYKDPEMQLQLHPSFPWNSGLNAYAMSMVAMASHRQLIALISSRAVTPWRTPHTGFNHALSSQADLEIREIRWCYCCRSSTMNRLRKIMFQKKKVPTHDTMCPLGSWCPVRCRAFILWCSHWERYTNLEVEAGEFPYCIIRGEGFGGKEGE